jgi:hypothetical protein
MLILRTIIQQKFYVILLQLRNETQTFLRRIFSRLNYINFYSFGILLFARILISIF